MRYHFIDAEQAEYPIVMLCRVMRVSRSGFYAWRERPLSVRQQANVRLVSQIRVIHAESRKTYGSPRIQKALWARGDCVGRHRVARLMRLHDLRACYRRRSRSTTQSKHGYPVASNILKRDFAPVRPNHVWAGDITYITTNEGWLYLAVVMDLYSRRIIGWSMGTRLHSVLTQEALSMALSQRRLTDHLLHHSDQGVQYAATDYQAVLSKHEITCSMSRKGNCWDNAVVESFFKTLKVECVHRQRFQTRHEARQQLFEYMEIFYNRQRLHSTLDYQSPVAYEALAA